MSFTGGQRFCSLLQELSVPFVAPLGEDLRSLFLVSPDFAPHAFSFCWVFFVSFHCNHSCENDYMLSTLWLYMSLSESSNLGVVMGFPQHNQITCEGEEEEAGLGRERSQVWSRLTKLHLAESCGASVVTCLSIPHQAKWLAIMPLPCSVTRCRHDLGEVALCSWSRPWSGRSTDHTACSWTPSPSLKGDLGGASPCLPNLPLELIIIIFCLLIIQLIHAHYRKHRNIKRKFIK